MPMIPSMTPAQIERMRADREARDRLGKSLHRDVDPNQLPKNVAPIPPIPARFTWAVPFEPAPYTREWEDKRRDDFLTMIDALNAPLPAIIRDASLFGLRPQSGRQNRTKTISVPAATGDGT